MQAHWNLWHKKHHLLKQSNYFQLDVQLMNLSIFFETLLKCRNKIWWYSLSNNHVLKFKLNRRPWWKWFNIPINTRNQQIISMNRVGKTRQYWPSNNCAKKIKAKSDNIKSLAQNRIREEEQYRTSVSGVKELHLI